MLLSCLATYEECLNICSASPFRDSDEDVVDLSTEQKSQLQKQEHARYPQGGMHGCMGVGMCVGGVGRGGGGGCPSPGFGATPPLVPAIPPSAWD